MGTTLRPISLNDSVIPVALLALSLAACGTATVTSAPTSQEGAAITGVRSPQQRADADAAWVLASYVPPPGSARLSRPPAGVHGALSAAATRPFTPDVVDDSSLWQVPGPPSAILAYEKSHLPSRFRYQGEGTFGGAGYQVSEYQFTVVSGLGPVEAAELQVDSITSTSGQAYVRVDAQVTWQPARPAATFLPAGKIHAVVVTAVPGGNDNRRPPAPVTVTDPAKVQRLVSLVNGLPLYPPGTVPSCPMDDGAGLRLEFLATAGGPRMATAFVKANGCGGMFLLLGAGTLASTGFATGDEVALGEFDYKAASQALAISGLRWTSLRTGCPRYGGHGVVLSGKK